jgi:hypothetical protein
MRTLSLIDTEQQVLVQCLEAHIHDLWKQIWHANDYDRRESLKARKRLILGLMDRLKDHPVEHQSAA